MWASVSQRAYFYANPKLHKYIAEFNAATPKGAKLPYKVGQQESNLTRLAKRLASEKRM